MRPSGPVAAPGPLRATGRLATVWVGAQPPQTFALPPPPQVCGAVQLPQVAAVREAPQLSVPVTLPQFLLSAAQNAASLWGVQPQTLAVPPPAQVCGAVQLPHEEAVRAAPQLSVPVTLPQFLPSAEQNAVSLSGVQPQTL